MHDCPATPQRHQAKPAGSVQMDILMRERKEAQEAAANSESSKKGQEAQSNAYLNLMPLALPAPPLPGQQSDGFGNGGSYPGGGFGGQQGGAPAYSQQGGFGPPQYGGGF